MEENCVKINVGGDAKQDCCSSPKLIPKKEKKIKNPIWTLNLDPKWNFFFSWALRGFS